MPITAMPVVAPADTITSAGWNIITANISLLDGRTGGDPGAADKFLISSGALGAAWTARATALDDRVAVAGDTMTGALGVDKNTGTVDSSLYARAGLSVHTTDTSRPALAFVRDGTGAVALYYESGTTLGIMTSGGVVVAILTNADAINAATLDGLDSTELARLAAASNFTTAPTINGGTVWHSGNDGSGSGLDADTLDTINSTGFARLAATSDFTTTPTINSITIAKRISGSYTGNNVGGRQILTGFGPTLVILYWISGGNLKYALVANGSPGLNLVFGVGTTTQVGSTLGLDGSDGFFVSPGDDTNSSGVTYRYVAIG